MSIFTRPLYVYLSILGNYWVESFIIFPCFFWFIDYAGSLGDVCCNIFGVWLVTIYRQPEFDINFGFSVVILAGFNVNYLLTRKSFWRTKCGSISHNVHQCINWNDHLDDYISFTNFSFWCKYLSIIKPLKPIIYAWLM